MSNAAEEKTCPYCAETIKEAAVVCRYCGRDLGGSVERAAPSAPSEVQARSGVADGVKLGCGMFIVLPLLLLGLLLFLLFVGVVSI